MSRTTFAHIEYKDDSARRFHPWAKVFLPPDETFLELITYDSPLLATKSLPADISFEVRDQAMEFDSDIKDSTWFSPDEWQHLIDHYHATHDAQVEPEYRAALAVLRTLPNARLVCWFTGK